LSLNSSFNLIYTITYYLLLYCIHLLYLKSFYLIYSVLYLFYSNYNLSGFHRYDFPQTRWYFILSFEVTILPDNSFSDPTRFYQIVGALQYLTFTRLDICFVVNEVCQFMHAPTNSHWVVVKRILRYLKGTISYGFLITRGFFFFSLHGFIDADWVGSIDDRKSTGIYLVFFGQTPIS